MTTASALLPFLAARPVLAAASDGDGLDYLEMARHSGPIGLAVLLLLLCASAVCWAIIVKKWLQIRRAQDESVKFLETFWQSKRLDAIYQAAESLSGSPLSHVFRAGYVELSKVTAGKRENGERGLAEEMGGIENVERALKRAAASEVTALERQVPFLGTTASAAPFVGLFGTVWGIMSAFHDIYRMGNANLATVARPISEALIATAVGLFAAIPAVVAYNFFISKIRVLDSEMTNFSSDFLNIVRRHFFS
ncbi:MotA/TolQ/ExbB proton channel family protein [Anaeromyxobacter oryzisoli]|uniref:MotA/TolQ/ExbB proton channel family protein n=1 Tax=Anaeromyxobacter oryzisoli TaxID=2925408 RepID=UPI001F56BD4F|nr:MotA/TolQ/ExbB proton channel family protein [Anaeromyxobacter sp. SG63]